MNNDRKNQIPGSLPSNVSTLVTGATGLLGSHIAGELLRNGQLVTVLIRRKGGLTANQRFESICDFLGLSSAVMSNVRIVEGSLEKNHFGLGKKIYDELCHQAIRIIHCAGNTTFAEKNRADSVRDNITGLYNILDFAKNSHCKWFHLISTIYVNGLKKGVCEETVNDSGLFTNVYEETKSHGEIQTLNFCNENGIGTTILRPSIVVGDSHNGRTFRFNGLYYPLKALILLRDMFSQDLATNQGKRATRINITRKNGTINLPLRFEHNAEEGINLIPIDFLVNVVNSIIEQPKDGLIYHISAKKNVTIAELIDFTHSYFNITGLTTVQTGFFETHSKTALECLFDKYIEPYLPYMKDNRKFSTKNTDNVLESRGINCPVFDYDVFSRCMSFAEKTNWGKIYNSKIIPNITM
ncbi:SDR family oxidoreductase [Candidatus Latescibacterota bacterium]